jgi:molybdopterin-guanine dinucleotide biosynthesis protein A
VLQRMARQASLLGISANRNVEAYADLWRACVAAPADALPPVWPDAADLPPRSGPLAGMLTALRRLQGDWIQFVPCDSPRLPPDLIARLLAAAMAANADIVVPQTLDDPDTPRHHWVCALVHRRALPSLETHFAQGERKVSRWVGTLSWRSVFFEDSDAFANINTMETPHECR